MLRASTLIKITLVAAIPMLAARVDEMGVERRSRNTDRVAAYGATTEGAAWTYYEAAFEGMDDVWEALPIRNFDAVEDRTPEGRARRELILRDLAPAFEALHRCAHARDARTGMNLADGSVDGVHLLTRAHYLGSFAIARAVAQVERGEDMEAVATLRYALALHLAREAESPADPWGHGVRAEVEGDRVRVWTPNRDDTGPLDVSILGQ